MTYLVFRILLVLNVILFFFISACDRTKKDDDYRSGVTVKIETPHPDPMNHALNLLALQPADLIGPLYQEAGYHPVSRVPIIDHVARSPFYLHGWADDISVDIQRNGAGSLFEVLSLMIRTLNGGVTYRTGEEMTAATDSRLLDAYIHLCRRYNVVPDHNAISAINNAGFSEAFDSQLGRLLMALTAASDLTQKAIAGLNPEELAYISSRPERYFFPAGVHFSFLTAPTYVPDDVLPIARKIDFVSLYTAGLVMSRGVDEFITFFRKLPRHNRTAHLFEDATKSRGVVLDINMPVGKLVVFGQDNNIIAGSGALVVDLGGNDRYTGGVAVGSRMPGRVALSIDTDGNDVYDRGDKRFGQGFGCLSLGMLIDISGDDKYLAGNMSQGSGMYGIGLLADFQGRDYYRMGLMGQGFGLFGVGLLLDAEGSDRYILYGMGQGAGSTVGFGSLVDLSGNDKYLTDKNVSRGILVADNWSHVQGAGLSIRSPEWQKHFSYYGGIGLLSDGGGDDFYFASDGNSMGSSYFLSIGALVDHGGDDRYMPQNGYGLGYAVHLSNGIVIDRNGKDTYYGRTHTGGVGSDRSVAVLADYAGDDTYGPSEEYAKGLIGYIGEREGDFPSDRKIQEKIYQVMAESSYASALKPKALGILIDYSGNDRYFANPIEKGESCGGVTPPVEPQNWSHAMHFDLGGNDFYYKDRRKNNHYFKYLHHGLCYDIEYPDPDPDKFGKKRLSDSGSRSMTIEKIRTLSRGSGVINDLIHLTDNDLFVRFAATGKIIQKGAASIPYLVGLLSVSDDAEFNRDLIEILDTFVISGELKQYHSRYLEALLEAGDPFVRIFAARTLGDRHIKNSLPALVRASTERDDAVRFHIIRALGQADSAEALEVLTSMAATDTSVQCRREAIISLGRQAEKMTAPDSVTTEKLRATLLKALTDPDETVRSFAAFGLRNFADEPAVVSGLKKAIRDGSVYVRRTAAKSLSLNGFKEGIPVLIETLKFPSIDTFPYYDNEIAKDLSFYTGIDFAEDQRYAYYTWYRWWQDNGRSVNLKQNLDILRTIQEAFEAPSEDAGVKIFQRLLQENPDSIVVRKRYLRYCQEWINFRLLTSRQITPEILERCLRLQKIMTDLEPETAERWAQLAYYYARLFRYEDAAKALESAIAIEPQNETFTKTLRQYRRQIKE
jgi:tetratricopeptide (TPR) repeat protein